MTDQEDAMHFARTVAIVALTIVVGACLGQTSVEVVSDKSDQGIKGGPGKGEKQLEVSGYFGRMGGYNQNQVSVSCGYFLEDWLSVSLGVSYFAFDQYPIGTRAEVAAGPLVHIYLSNPKSGKGNVFPYIFGGYQFDVRHAGIYGDQNTSLTLYGIGAEFYLGKSVDNTGMSLFVETLTSKNPVDTNSTQILEFGLRIYFR